VARTALHRPGGRVKVLVRLGRLFAKEAGFSERTIELPKGATAEDLLHAVGKASPPLSCVDDATGAVDPAKLGLQNGDVAYLYSTMSGG
jgi:hypothetical protein